MRVAVLGAGGTIAPAIVRDLAESNEVDELRLLARERVAARGALPPELCLDPGEMFSELERRGVRFKVQPLEDVGLSTGLAR